MLETNNAFEFPETENLSENSESKNMHPEKEEENFNEDDLLQSLNDVMCGKISDSSKRQSELTSIFEKLSKVGTEKSIDYTCKLIEMDGEILFMYDLVPVLKINPEYSTEKLLLLLDELDPRNNNLNEWQFPQLMILMADLLGAENLRDRLNKSITEKGTSGKYPDALEYAFSQITPNSDKTAISNLQNFYQENIKFEEYEVNKRMNQKEVALLQGLIGKDERVLEMGCGTGRLFSEMNKAGYDTVGVDFTPRHIELIRKKDPEAKVFEADWHDTKLSGGEYGSVYSLGRNILHDYSFIDQVATFREANRLLKVGGKFIFDIPNREKGSYGEMVRGYAQEMKNRGIKNFRYGSIYDSPDGEHFATRYTYSHEDIDLLCQLTGFEIKRIISEKLETGKDDENIYYVVEKK